jgi:TRAP-type C4-dicarboxylate transport system permease large subunit
MTMHEIFAALWPFMIMQICALVIVVCYPEIALWLPTLVYGK